MKKLILFIFVAIVSFPSENVIAQNSKTIEDVLDALSNAEVFIRNRKFKKELESYTKELGSKISDYDDYEALNIGYNLTQEVYNEYLSDIKRDLSSYRQIKRMIRKPHNFAQKYLDNFNEVIEVYEDEFEPIAKRIEAKYKTKGVIVSPAIITLSLELFKGIVDLIRNRREERSESLNTILTLINEQFYRKFRLKDWTQLNITVPNKTREVETLDDPIAKAKIKGKKKDKVDGLEGRSRIVENNNVTNESLITSRIVDIEPPVFDDLHGWLEFNFINNEGAPQRMAFSKLLSKDIGVEILQSKKGKIKKKKLINNTAFFNSVAQFAEGTQFQLKAFNSAGMYVLTENMDKTISFLYPFDNDQLGNCDEGTKDITVMPSTFVIGKDRNKVTTLPLQDCTTRPPAERYFTIQGNAQIENFCVILSKSELDIEDLRQTLAQLEGPMHEKLAIVFGHKLVNPEDADVQIMDNRMTFNTFDGEKSVLPVVFYINR